MTFVLVNVAGCSLNVTCIQVGPLGKRTRNGFSDVPRLLRCSPLKMSNFHAAVVMDSRPEGMEPGTGTGALDAWQKGATATTADYAKNRVTFSDGTAVEGENSQALENADTFQDEGGWSDFTDSEDELDDEEKPPDTLRGKIHQAIVDPSSSKPATAFAVFMVIILLTSTAMFLATSYPQYQNHKILGLQVLEAVCIGFFTLEYLIAVVTAPVPWRWMIQPFSIIDLIAILPFYLELILEGSKIKGLAVIRVIRILRIFRLLKVGKYSVNVQILFKTLRKSVDGLMLLGFMLFIMILMLSSLLFFAEQSEGHFDEDTKIWMREDGSISPFQSIVHTFWWCITTVTTTGYGDSFPVTLAGKIVAGFTMITGLIMLAFPISIIGSNFNGEWFTHREKVRLQKQQARARLVSRYKGWKRRKLVANIERVSFDVATSLNRLTEELQLTMEKQRNLAEMVEELKFSLAASGSLASSSSNSSSSSGSRKALKLAASGKSNDSLSKSSDYLVKPNDSLAKSNDDDALELSELEPKMKTEQI